MKYYIERSIVINADKDKVMGLVKDFKHWDSWSPWTVLEPDSRVNTKIEGTPGQVGQTMSWKGDLIGTGTNTLSKVEDDSFEYDLVFFSPWKSEAKTKLTFESQGQSTKVIWTMDSSIPFFLFFMVNAMKALISMDYDRGLKMLKAMAEQGEIKASTTNKGVVDFEGFSYVGIKKTMHMDAIPTEMKKDFEKVIADIVKGKGKSAKHWFCLYPKFNMKDMTMTYIAGISDEELGDVDLGDDYVRGTIASTKALQIHHEGSYEFLGNAWSLGMMWVRLKKMKQTGVPFEYYHNSPLEVQPEELKTSIYFPVRE